jgi:hypothetical protein
MPFNQLQKLFLRGLNEKSNYAEEKCLVDLIFVYRTYKDEFKALEAGMILKIIDNPNRGLQILAKQNRTEEIPYYLDHLHASPRSGVIGAAGGGHKKLFDHFVALETLHHPYTIWNHPWEDAMEEAIKNDQKQIIFEYADQKTCLYHKSDLYQYYSNLLEKSTEYQNVDIAKFILKRVKANDRSLAHALLLNNKVLIDMMLESLTESGDYNWDTALKSAAAAGNYEMVLFFIEKGATRFKDVLNGVVSPPATVEIFDLFLERALTGSTDQINLAGGRYKTDNNLLFYITVLNERDELIKHMIKLGVTDWYGGLIGAVKGKSEYWINYFLKKGVTLDSELLYAAIEANNLKVFKICIDEIFVTPPPIFHRQYILDTALSKAAVNNNYEMMQILVDFGASNISNTIEWIIFEGNHSCLTLRWLLDRCETADWYNLIRRSYVYHLLFFIPIIQQHSMAHGPWELDVM